MVKIFVIHGMGKYDSDWWNKVEPDLKKIKRFDKIRGPLDTLKSSDGTIASLMDMIDFVPVIYDDAMVKLQTATQQGDDLDALIKLIKDEPGNTKTQAELDAWKASASKLSTKADPFQKSDFLKDNVWDVFLVANDLTRHYLALQIAKQILVSLSADPGVEWGILAHSLGTGIIHDVLNLIHSELSSLDQISNATIVCLIANFSKTFIGPILTSVDPVSHATSVWPSESRTRSACRYYLAARHKLDPLSYLGQDMPPWNNPPSGFAVNRYKVLGHKDLDYAPAELDLSDPVTVGSYNHSLPNYLSYPAIHLPLLLRATGYQRYLKPDAFAKANQDFIDSRIPTVIDFVKLVSPTLIKTKSQWFKRAGELFWNYT